MEALVAITYRCNARCHMCNTWQYPSAPGDEVTPGDLRSLPAGLSFVNITGGEPFVRTDIDEFVEVLLPKTRRIVVSTNGYFTDRVVELATRFPQLGFRVSLEGLPTTNDSLRGLDGGFDHGLRTLLKLRALGIKDIGFGITVSDRNVTDLPELYELAEAMGLEFATAAVHNTYYFHKFDNHFEAPEAAACQLESLARRQLRTHHPKNWFRAWFNMGLANYVRGGQRLLPCHMGTDVFFVDPFGDVRPCNALEASMGSLKQSDFSEIWSSQQADDVRRRVAQCPSDCWMIGSVSPAMKRHIRVPTAWVLKAKLSGSLPEVRGLRENPRRK